MNKQFWKTYWADKGRRAYMIIVMLVITLIWTVIIKHIPWFFMLGYMLADPFNYYIVSYKKQTKIDKLK